VVGSGAGVGWAVVVAGGGVEMGGDGVGVAGTDVLGVSTVTVAWSVLGVGLDPGSFCVKVEVTDEGVARFRTTRFTG